ncbi:MAG: hypothetical protein BWY84_00907 [Candidatus Aerophobetes bacterium ADurb.Bin490]|nr:MAG: hypothetical protein BWY84_00907 [Candidatus Aerophobetes bacterium ADurb.Bin490]
MCRQWWSIDLPETTVKRAIKKPASITLLNLSLNFNTISSSPDASRINSGNDNIGLFLINALDVMTGFTNSSKAFTNLCSNPVLVPASPAATCAAAHCIVSPLIRLIARKTAPITAIEIIPAAVILEPVSFLYS